MVTDLEATFIGFVEGGWRKGREIIALFKVLKKVSQIKWYSSPLSWRSLLKNGRRNPMSLDLTFKEVSIWYLTNIPYR